MTNSHTGIRDFQPADTAPLETWVETAHLDCPGEVLMGYRHSDGWSGDGSHVVDGEVVEPTHWRFPPEPGKSNRV